MNNKNSPPPFESSVRVIVSVLHFTIAQASSQTIYDDRDDANGEEETDSDSVEQLVLGRRHVLVAAPFRRLIHLELSNTSRFCPLRMSVPVNVLLT